jgi:hypothetical protein
MKKNGIDYSVNNLVVDFMYDERKKMTSSQKNNMV